jgi:hypothetical protein
MDAFFSWFNGVIQPFGMHPRMQYKNVVATPPRAPRIIAVNRALTTTPPTPASKRPARYDIAPIAAPANTSTNHTHQGILERHDAEQATTAPIFILKPPGPKSFGSAKSVLRIEIAPRDIPIGLCDGLDHRQMELDKLITPSTAEDCA